MNKSTDIPIVDDALIANLNTCFVIYSATLVFFMLPGLGFFYSGMAQTKNALILLLLCCITIVIVSIQWYLWGYSLAFSEKGGFFIGNFDYVLLNGVNGDYYGNLKLPKVAHMIYESMFAVIAPALIIGAAAERLRFFSCAVFIFLWTNIVYDFIAYWVWAPHGWLHVLGNLDFAGGGPVHISSGCSALAYAVILGTRKGFGEKEFKPHNMTHVVLGTSMLWFGWFGFNGGSVLSPNSRSANAVFITNLAAGVGGLTWMMVDKLVHKKKYSALGFCSGAVSGLVCITPASGYVAPASSLLFGIVPGIACNYATKLKYKYNFDDALDAFAIHGIAGALGCLMTAIFAQKWVAELDGIVINGGWLDGNFILIVYHIAGIAANMTWSFGWTFAILYAMKKCGMTLRIPPEMEDLGADLAECGEVAYEHVEETKCIINAILGERSNAV